MTAIGGEFFDSASAGGGSTAEAVQWQRLREWIETETGMNFAGSRQSRLLEAVRKVLARRSLAAPDLERLLGKPDERCQFLERVTAELTVGESYFFRNEHHFRTLRETVLPEILRQNAAQREVRIWSAGCAAGEEPYSLAILLDQVLGGRLDSWRISILGTDLNPEFLDRARAGLYRTWSFRQTNIHQDRNYMVPEGDGFRLVPRIRNLVRFAYLNLVKDVYPSPLTGTLGLDLILFRNVAIYLRPEITRAIIARFLQALRPGGWLLLGEAEVNLAVTEGFQVHRFDQATFHQRSENVALSPGVSLPSPTVLDATAPGVAVPGVSVPRVPPLPVWTPLPARPNVGSGQPPPASKLPVTQALERMVLGQAFAEAEQAVARISDRPARARARLAYCKLLLSRAQIARAREMLALCLKEEPLLLEAQLLAAGFAEEAGDREAAERAYRRAIYIDRTCPMSHFHLGLVLDQQGKREAARHSLQIALSLTEGKLPESCVEYGEGVCYGRLRELITLLLNQ